VNFLGDMVENLHHSTASAHEKGDQVIQLLESVESRLADLFEAVTAETDQDEYLPLSFTAPTDAGGALATLIQRRPGYVAELVSVSVVGAAANAGLTIWINDASPVNLVFAGTVSGPGGWSAELPPGTVIPDGSNVLVQVANGGVTQNVTVTIRSRRKMLDRGRIRNVQNV
jgi:hypothetical protein